MSYFPYPNLSGTPEEQLRQLKGYLYQLVDQLNYSPAFHKQEQKGEENGKS